MNPTFLALKLLETAARKNGGREGVKQSLLAVSPAENSSWKRQIFRGWGCFAHPFTPNQARLEGEPRGPAARSIYKSGTRTQKEFTTYIYIHTDTQTANQRRPTPSLCPLPYPTSSSGPTQDSFVPLLLPPPRVDRAWGRKE